MQVIELTNQQLNVVMESQSKDGVVVFQVGNDVYVGYSFDTEHYMTRKFDAVDFKEWMNEITSENEINGTVH